MGPNSPSAGPIFPIAEAAAPIEDSISSPIVESRIVDIINADMKNRKNPSVFLTTSSLISCFPILTGSNALACNMRRVSSAAYFTNSNEIVLADELSPDNFRLWDKDTSKKLDKDRFREDLGNLTDAYQEVAARLGITINKT